MHISDGILPVTVTVGSYLTTGGITAFLSTKIKREKIPKIATFTSILFISSLFHLKIGPTSVHPILNGLGAILLAGETGPGISQFGFIYSPIVISFEYTLLRNPWVAEVTIIFEVVNCQYQII